MSRSYEMLVKVSGMKPSRKKSVEKACCAECSFEPESFSEETETKNTSVLRGKAYVTLCAGESEEEFTDRLAKAVWTANGKYCEVEVQALYLEELPYEQHVRESRFKNGYCRLCEQRYG